MGFDTISSIVFTHNTFVNNVTSSSVINIYGAGGRTPMFETIISDNCFLNNTGISGGAIHVLNTNYDNNKIIRMVIEKNFFVNNKALEGGAIIIEGEKVVIRNNRFENNSAKGIGGALYLKISPSIVENNIFLNNSVVFDSVNYGSPTTEGGGAIHVMFGVSEENFSDPCIIAGNCIAFNRAPSGGAIHCNAARTLLVNNTICYNLSN
jgi:hypothetical protein